jgi:hypothetical protein
VKPGPGGHRLDWRVATEYTAGALCNVYVWSVDLERTMCRGEINMLSTVAQPGVSSIIASIFPVLSVVTPRRRVEHHKIPASSYYVSV